VDLESGILLAVVVLPGFTGRMERVALLFIARTPLHVGDKQRYESLDQSIVTPILSLAISPTHMRAQDADFLRMN
jgi:hypothetical protein